MMDFTFEDSPWEQALNCLQQGENISAARFLTLMEGESEQALEDAFDLLESKGAWLDMTAMNAVAAQGQLAVRLRQEQQLVEKGDLLHALEEGDPLRVYLEELALLPIQGDISLLAQQHLEGKDCADKLADLSLSRVVQIAQEYTGRGVLLLDLIQEGGMGLWEGILSYTGGDFESHRDQWIRHHMDRAVITQALAGGVGQKLRQALADYRDTDQRLLAELGRNPTTEEIAEAMHVTEEAALVYADMLRSARSDDRVHAQPEEEPEEEEQAVENTAYFQMRQRIAELLSSLTEQQAKVLTLRFGLEGGLPMTPQQTGEKLGMTADEVVAAETAALAQLRTQ